jgi:hypothetical protein
LIKDKVAKDCSEGGTDPGVDIDMALKMYNDYCTSNGFPVPGYTYISTQTVRMSRTAAPTSTNAAISTVVITRAITFGAGNGGIGATTIGGTGTATPTVILFASSASPQALPGVWAYLVYFFVMLPIKLIMALPESLVVTYTVPAPAAAVSSVETKVIVDPTAPATSIETVVYTPLSTTSQTSITDTFNSISTSTSSISSNTSGGTRNGGGGSGRLTSLEIAGIVIGIVVGLISALATVVMCLRGSRGLIRG